MAAGLEALSWLLTLTLVPPGSRWARPLPLPWLAFGSGLALSPGRQGSQEQQLHSLKVFQDADLEAVRSAAPPQIAALLRSWGRLASIALNHNRFLPGGQGCLGSLRKQVLAWEELQCRACFRPACILRPPAEPVYAQAALFMADASAPARLHMEGAQLLAGAVSRPAGACWAPSRRACIACCSAQTLPPVVPPASPCQAGTARCRVQLRMARSPLPRSASGSWTQWPQRCNCWCHLWPGRLSQNTWACWAWLTVSWHAGLPCSGIPAAADVVPPAHWRPAALTPPRQEAAHSMASPTVVQPQCLDLGGSC